MQKPQKILYVITKSNFGGAQRYVYELATTLHEAGYPVAVAAGGEGELITRLRTVPGMAVFSIAGAQRDIKLRQELVALFSLYKIIKNFQPDVVHLNSSKVGVLGSLVARLLGVKRIVFTAHGWPFREPRQPWWRLMAWLGSYLTALLVHRVITVSQHDKNVQRMPFVAKKTTPIYPALYPFSPLPRDEARLALYSETVCSEHAPHIWLGTVGELNQNKNHSTLIDAVANFNSENNAKLFLTIIGEGELKHTLAEQIELRGASNFITLFGSLPEARRYLKAFDIFVLPSHKEGLPYALLEAGYAGLPCVASQVGGIPEVISAGVSGFLINPKSPQAIEKSLAVLINEPDLRIAMANRLSEKIISHFNPTTATAKIIACYRD